MAFVRLEHEGAIARRFSGNEASDGHGFSADSAMKRAGAAPARPASCSRAAQGRDRFRESRERPLLCIIGDPGRKIMANTQIDSDDVGRRFCDLVMKGGITSGVVFPKAVARLSDQYRFRNIGGTSAGAIAAAGAAAAEYRRATDAASPQYGFAKFAGLAQLLGERPTGEHSRLFSLFQPEPATRK